MSEEKTLKQLVEDFLEAQDLADKSASALLNSTDKIPGLLFGNSGDVGGRKMVEKIEENAEFLQYFKMLEMLNHALDNTVYLLFEKYESKCAELAEGILGLVMKVHLDLQSCVLKEDGEYRAALIAEADRRLQIIADLETRFFKSIQANEDLFKRATEMLCEKIDGLELEALDTTAGNELVIDGPLERTMIFATREGKVQGVVVEFDGDLPERVRLYEDGVEQYGFEFAEDGEGGSLDIPDKETSILPIVGAVGGAALLGAAVFAKLSSIRSQNIQEVQSVAVEAIKTQG